MSVTSRRLRSAIPVAIGKHCPGCGERTRRRRTPLLLRPLKLLTLGHCSYRTCLSCVAWKGVALTVDTAFAGSHSPVANGGSAGPPERLSTEEVPAGPRPEAASRRNGSAGHGVAIRRAGGLSPQCEAATRLAMATPAPGTHPFPMTRYRIKEWPARERPRERLREAGPAALSTRELLAILVGSGTGDRSAVDVAGELLLRADGSLRRLAATPPRSLQRAPGVGPAVAARVGAALELGRRLAREGPAARDRIRGPSDVYERCAPALRDLQYEEFRVLLLNTQHAVTHEILVTRGTLDASVVHPREVFKPAVVESASAVILVHNHPSGDPTPSPEDHAITRQIADAGAILGIPVLDHIVIGDARYVSFVETGMIEPDGDR